MVRSNTHRPMVTVIVPTHNSSATIARVLYSIAQQTLQDYEVIVVDDASTDRTCELLRQLAAEDSRIQPIYLRQNGGPSVARNRGLERASGQWIALLDADDWYLPDRLSVLISQGCASGADFASDDLELYDEDEMRKLGPMLGPLGLAKILDTATFVLGNMPNPSRPRVGYGFLKPIFRAEFIHAHSLRYNEQMRFAEDYRFYLQALLAGAKWVMNPRPMYVYSIRSRSLTANHGPKDLSRLCKVDEDALLSPCLPAGVARVLRSHLRSTEKRFAFAAFSISLKQGRLTDAVRAAAYRSHTIGYVMIACFINGPTILRRALRSRTSRRKS